MAAGPSSSTSAAQPTPTAIRRLSKDYQKILSDPIDGILALPREDNILEWHYVLRGTKGTPYDGGLYHGRLVFAPDFPWKPPSIYMMTPNGRFSPNTRLCLSISDYHPESWNPGWTVSAILVGLHSFMNEVTFATGCETTTDERKKELAVKSKPYNMSCKLFCELFPSLVEELRTANTVAMTSDEAKAHERSKATCSRYLNRYQMPQLPVQALDGAAMMEALEAGAVADIAARRGRALPPPRPPPHRDWRDAYEFGPPLLGQPIHRQAAAARPRVDDGGAVPDADAVDAGLNGEQLRAHENGLLRVERLRREEAARAEHARLAREREFEYERIRDNARRAVRIQREERRLREVLQQAEEEFGLVADRQMRMDDGDEPPPFLHFPPPQPLQPFLPPHPALPPLPPLHPLHPLPHRRLQHRDQRLAAAVAELDHIHRDAVQLEQAAAAHAANVAARRAHLNGAPPVAAVQQQQQPPPPMAGGGAAAVGGGGEGVRGQQALYIAAGFMRPFQQLPQGAAAFEGGAPLNLGGPVEMGREPMAFMDVVNGQVQAFALDAVVGVPLMELPPDAALLDAAGAAAEEAAAAANEVGAGYGAVRRQLEERRRERLMRRWPGARGAYRDQALLPDQMLLGDGNMVGPAELAVDALLAVGVDAPEGGAEEQVQQQQRIGGAHGGARAVGGVDAAEEAVAAAVNGDALGGRLRHMHEAGYGPDPWFPDGRLPIFRHPPFGMVAAVRHRRRELAAERGREEAVEAAAAPVAAAVREEGGEQGQRAEPQQPQEGQEQLRGGADERGRNDVGPPLVEVGEAAAGAVEEAADRQRSQPAAASTSTASEAGQGQERQAAAGGGEGGEGGEEAVGPSPAKRCTPDAGIPR